VRNSFSGKTALRLHLLREALYVPISPVQDVLVVSHKIVRVYRLVRVAVNSEQRFGGLVLPLLLVVVPIQEEGFVESFLGLLCLRPLFPAILFLGLGLLLLVGLCFRMFMGRLGVGMADGLVVSDFIISNKLIFVAEDLLLGLQEL
jgi:hypothetical protein